MASSPQGIYTGLKTAMKKAYYTDNMVNNLENFRAEASAFLSGPGEYEDLSFLKICANLEGNGDISWNKLDSLKTLVKSASRGKKQLLNMINDAEREIQESLSGLASPLPPERDAPKRRMKDEEMVVQMDRDVFRVKEKDVAILECSVHPKPKRVVWRKGDENQLDKRIIINNRKYFGAGPSSPALVIKEAEKTDEAYYQCIANKYEIEAKGKAVPLKVDSNEERGSNKHGTHRSPSASSSGTEGSPIDRNSKSSSRSQDNHMEFHSFSPEDRHQGKQNIKELAIQILMSSCQMMFTISNYNDVARLFSFIEDAFYAATGEKKRIDTLDFKQKCIQVFITIKAANSLSEAPAVCLAEQFKHYILDVGLQLSEESNAILEVDEASIKITPEHMPEDGLPLVNISHQQGAVPHSESVILQTYIIASPPALSIEWFKIKADDHEISIEIDCKKYYGGSELSPSLIIRNINVDDQGWYICRATNKTGTACSNKTFVGISSDSTQAEDKPGKLVTDIIDIPEQRRRQPAGSADKPGKLLTDISDIPVRKKAVTMYKLLPQTKVLEEWESPADIYSICPTTDGQVWTCDSDTLTLLDRNGKLIQQVQHKAVINNISLSPTTHTLWVCDRENNIMELVSGRLIHRFSTKEYPMCICVTACNHVIVGMTDNISKFTTKGQMVLTTSAARTGKPLVCSPYRISECPVTHNVAVVARNDQADGGDGIEHVIVMDSDFKELFVYRGDIPSTYKQSSRKGAAPFHPWGVVYDSVGNIIIGDLNNNRVLLISGRGEFLRIIHTGTHWTYAVGVDREDVLWAVFGGCNVKLLQYNSA